MQLLETLQILNAPYASGQRFCRSERKANLQHVEQILHQPAQQRHAGETIGWLLWVNHFGTFDVVATEGKASEIVGVVLHQILGNNIKIGHTLPTFHDTHRDVKARVSTQRPLELESSGLWN